MLGASGEKILGGTSHRLHTKYKGKRASLQLRDLVNVTLDKRQNLALAVWNALTVSSF